MAAYGMVSLQYQVTSFAIVLYVCVKIAKAEHVCGGLYYGTLAVVGDAACYADVCMCTM